jgi:peroxiredoxin
VRRYIEDEGLPFEILIDETRSAAAYGVWHAWGSTRITSRGRQCS